MGPRTCSDSKWFVLASVEDSRCLSRIPDPDFFPPGSEFFPFQIPDPVKEFKHFNPQKVFPSTQKCDLGCSSRIRILSFYHPEYQDRKGTGACTVRGRYLFFRNPGNICTPPNRYKYGQNSLKGVICYTSYSSDTHRYRSCMIQV